MSRATYRSPTINQHLNLAVWDVLLLTLVSHITIYINFLYQTTFIVIAIISITKIISSIQTVSIIRNVWLFFSKYRRDYNL